MYYLRYLCLFAYSDVPHILCCVFVLFIYVLCTLCCQFLWIVHFCLPIYSDVPHILCCVFVLFIYVLCTLLSVPLDCSLLFTFRYSLMFIYIQYNDQKKKIKTITMDDKILHRQLEIERH